MCEAAEVQVEIRMGDDHGVTLRVMVDLERDAILESIDVPISLQGAGEGVTNGNIKK